MLLKAEREQVIKYCQKLLTRGLTIGTGGNISILNRQHNFLVISPSGLDYFDLTPQDIVIVERQGNIIDGQHEPSTELKFHLALDEQREDITAVVHTHSVNAHCLFSRRIIRCSLLKDAYSKEIP
jgi:L-fuculose-phosphate aldolase